MSHKMLSIVPMAALSALCLLRPNAIVPAAEAAPPVAPLVLATGQIDGATGQANTFYVREGYWTSAKVGTGSYTITVPDVGSNFLWGPVVVTPFNANATTSCSAYINGFGSSSSPPTRRVFVKTLVNGVQADCDFNFFFTQPTP